MTELCFIFSRLPFVLNDRSQLAYLSSKLASGVRNEFRGAIAVWPLRILRADGKRRCVQFDLSYCQIDIAEFRTEPVLTCLKFRLWLLLK